MEPPIPVSSSPAGTGLFHPDGQSCQPSQGTSWRKRSDAQRVRSVDFPFPVWQRGGGAAEVVRSSRPEQGVGWGGAPSPDIRGPSTDSIKEGQPDTVTTGKVTRGSVPAAREGSDLFPRPIQEPPCKPRRLTQPDDKGKGAGVGGLEVSDGPTRHSPAITGVPTAASPPPADHRSGQSRADHSTMTCHLTLVLLALWNILPVFSLGGTRGGPGLPRMLAQDPVSTPLPKNYAISLTALRNTCHPGP